MVSKLLQIGCDVVDTLYALAEADRRDSHQHTQSFANKGTIILIDFACIVCKPLCSNKTLSKIKGAEAVFRAGNIYFDVVTADPNMSRFEILRKRALPATCSFLRTLTEKGIYDERHFLSLPPEQQGKQLKVVPIYDASGAPVCDDDGNHTYQAEPCTAAEAEKKLSALEKSNRTLVKAELNTRIYFPLAEVAIPRLLVPMLRSLVNRNILVPIHNEQGVQAEPEMPKAPLSDITYPFDLVNLDKIPDELHNDPVLSKLCCPLSLMPIRDPVGDPNGVEIYERSFILENIRFYHRSPVTHRPLEANQLIELPLVKALIDDRLRSIGDELRRIAHGHYRVNFEILRAAQNQRRVAQAIQEIEDAERQTVQQAQPAAAAAAVIPKSADSDNERKEDK